jgi:hypothetical protein
MFTTADLAAASESRAMQNAARTASSNGDYCAPGRQGNARKRQPSGIGRGNDILAQN